MRLVLITDPTDQSPPSLYVDGQRRLHLGVATFPIRPCTLCRKLQEVACRGILACLMKNNAWQIQRSKQASKQEGGRKRFARPGECKGQMFLVVVVVGGLRRRAEGTRGRRAAQGNRTMHATNAAGRFSHYLEYE